MINTSTIKYDRDDPHIMKMVWDKWLENRDDFPDPVVNQIYDKWITGKTKLCIDQKVWNRIIVTYL